jgi:hypothetical protein
MTRPETAAEAHSAANTDGQPVHWYSSGCGRVELALTMEDAQAGSHSGACDADIAELLRVPYIAEQMAGIDERIAREVATESGRNDYGHGPEDMADHAANLAFILWMACGDIREGATE